MSTQNICPKCEKELDWVDGNYKCQDCDVSYKKFAYCPDCDAELEKLQACGAASYFCNTCNELKSKSLARFEFRPLA
ncbi:zinc ribbon domain-containing protein [Vibrio hannami]|uniref:zinc ribbon domain-containing protein n=1 Tax=Vibrio hannami TaxID=2717094 RepID=UPI00240F882A|nr:zinc ribbon domain-containing protein [Vibrio hannami]MDG3087244.1 zinc ribbon domain-containing protein [Vibrio hannami]